MVVVPQFLAGFGDYYCSAFLYTFSMFNRCLYIRQTQGTAVLVCLRTIVSICRARLVLAWWRG